MIREEHFQDIVLKRLEILSGQTLFLSETLARLGSFVLDRSQLSQEAASEEAARLADEFSQIRGQIIEIKSDLDKK